jgi:N6-L-threonylcarbamoyladenine synthase
MGDKVLAFCTASDQIALAVGTRRTPEELSQNSRFCHCGQDRQPKVTGQETFGDTHRDISAQPCKKPMPIDQNQNPGEARKQIEVIASGDTLATRQANSRLLPAVSEMLTNAGLRLSDMAAIVVGLGPGSFTGVRIGVATAKGLALGLSLPLYGVGTLDAIAWGAWLAKIRGSIGVIADAMRGEVYPARFELTDKGVQRISAHTVAKPLDVAEQWQITATTSEPPLLLGDGLLKHSEAFAGYGFLPEELWRPCGAGLLHAWNAACQDGSQGSGDAGALVPIYTRLSDAEENERKRFAAAGELRQGAVLVAGETGAVSYRPMAAQDVSQVARLEAETFPEPNEAWSPQMVQDELGFSDRSCWVAVLGNEIKGFASGQIVAGQLSVLRVAVEAKARRKGVATRLLSRLIEDAKSLGCTTITLEVRASNTAAQALYRHFGLIEVGRRPRYYAALDGSRDVTAREDAIVMTGPILAVAGGIGATSGVAVISLAAGTRDVTNGAAGAGDVGAVAGESFSSTKATKRAAQPAILAIETSCDETAAAIIDGRGEICADIIASQVDFHHRFGGVVPEIASRKHTEAISGVVEAAMQGCGLGAKDLAAVAVTYAPGLIGALVVGVAFAKGLSFAVGAPLILVNHLEGHIYANKLAVLENSGQQTSPDKAAGETLRPPFGPDKVAGETLRPPFVIALLSGGTTMLVSVLDWGKYRVLGQTLDDAVGEAFDKVAKALGLGYPGGPAISALAESGNPAAIDFPRALMHSHGYDFSLSGLKTAVITWLKQQTAAGVIPNAADVAASFEQAVIDVQVSKALAACKDQGVTRFCIGGGVAANKALRRAYEQTFAKHGIEVIYPPKIACTDNAAMIALVAHERFAQGRFAPLEADAQANANLEASY